ncbi:MAG: hypothetical protein ACK5LK_00545 [Chthoniobacterales bacterium]
MHFVSIENNKTSTSSRILNASRHLGPMILRGERRITADHARLLSKYFAVDVGLFL